MKSDSWFSPARSLEALNFPRELPVELLDVLNDDIEERGVVLYRAGELLDPLGQVFICGQHLAGFTKARTMRMLIWTARSLRSIDASMPAPCSVKAKGAYLEYRAASFL